MAVGKVGEDGFEQLGGEGLDTLATLGPRTEGEEDLRGGDGGNVDGRPDPKPNPTQTQTQTLCLSLSLTRTLTKPDSDHKP